MTTLLDEVTAFGNLARAFQLCARGKRASTGYQRAMFAHGEKLVAMRSKILSGQYRWGRQSEQWAVERQQQRGLSLRLVVRPAAVRLGSSLSA